jgi:hypothetical protein
LAGVPPAEAVLVGDEVGFDLADPLLDCAALPFDREALPFDCAALPFDCAALPFDPEALPLDRAGVAFDREVPPDAALVRRVLCDDEAARPDDDDPERDVPAELLLLDERLLREDPAPVLRARLPLRDPDAPLAPLAEERRCDDARLDLSRSVSTAMFNSLLRTGSADSFPVETTVTETGSSFSAATRAFPDLHYCKGLSTATQQFSGSRSFSRVHKRMVVWRAHKHPAVKRICQSVVTPGSEPV